MIVIKKIFITNEDNNSILNCEIEEQNTIKLVWFMVEKEYGQYLCYERSDAFVIGLLNYAMRTNQDIVCNVPMTDEIHYNITKVLIPTLFKYGYGKLHSINIIAELEPAIGGDEVGTGCSCGIDSFSSIYNHYKTNYSNLDITYLTLNNVGAFNECYKEYGSDKVREERYAKVDKVAHELHLPIIKTNSNFADVFEQIHGQTHTYSSCFAIYCLQKLWCKYYYASSGIDYSGFDLSDADPAHYELLSLQCFSTSKLRIFSEGGEKTRIDKTNDILNFLAANNHLHVCLSKPYNCGICTKCKRTLLSLDALNGLENFKAVFDINYYNTHKKKYYQYLIEEHVHHNLMNEPTYKILSKRKEFKKLTFGYKFHYFFKRVFRKITKLFKKKIKRFLNDRFN